MNVLVINAGSSSLKYQLLNPTTGELLAKGLCERIGIDGLFTYKPQLPGKEAIKAASVSMPTHNEAIQAVLNALVDEKNGVIGSMKEIDAVGHRVVHGGEKFAKSVVITDEVMQAIEECNPLAPLHNPANIIGIKACQELMPGVPMVAVFDTAFHQTMPPVAYTYALPYEYYEKDKVRRYGFHGTSHQYVTERAAALLGRSPSALANKLRLLRLSPDCCRLLTEHDLTERHARALLRLEDEEERLNALHHIIRHHLNVAQTEQYIDKRLAQLQTTPPSGRRTFILKDVRLFLNSVDRGLHLMRQAGVDAGWNRQDTDREILLTIRIPKARRVG